MTPPCGRPASCWCGPRYRSRTAEFSSRTTALAAPSARPGRGAGRHDSPRLPIRSRCSRVVPLAALPKYLIFRARMGGRAVEGTGLENRQGATPRGFESHPIRQAPEISAGFRAHSDINQQKRRQKKLTDNGIQSRITANQHTTGQSTANARQPVQLEGRHCREQCVERRSRRSAFIGGGVRQHEGSAISGLPQARPPKTASWRTP